LNTLVTENSNNMYTTEIEKSKTHIMVQIIEYVPHSVVSKTIIRKTTGNISIVAIDTGVGLAERTSPFDTFVQVIDGAAEMVVDGKSKILGKGQGIIIPAHTASSVNAKEQFKMIQTIIKSGYELEL
jgi:quercetin dioxygenase-like cupin family protein